MKGDEFQKKKNKCSFCFSWHVFHISGSKIGQIIFMACFVYKIVSVLCKDFKPPPDFSKLLRKYIFCFKMEKVHRERPSQGLDNLEATYKEIGGGLNARHRTRHTCFENRNKMWSFTLSNEEPRVCVWSLSTTTCDVFFFLYAWTCVDSHALSHKQHKQCRHWNREGTVTYLFFSLLGFKNSQVWLVFLFGETSHETPCRVFVFSWHGSFPTGSCSLYCDAVTDSDIVAAVTINWWA